MAASLSRSGSLLLDINVTVLSGMLLFFFSTAGVLLTVVDDNPDRRGKSYSVRNISSGGRISRPRGELDEGEGAIEFPFDNAVAPLPERRVQQKEMADTILLTDLNKGIIKRDIEDVSRREVRSYYPLPCVP